MDFVRFPVATTNIFPIANSSAGGQLLTEWNLRTRESVGTHSNITYLCGPSYTHSSRDFSLSIGLDSTGSGSNTSVLEISPGVAIVNGHFIKLDTPILVNISEANEYIRTHPAENLSTLQGRLCVGLRVMYSTAYTVASSMLVENDQDLYEGIKVVILPASEFKLPEDSPDVEENVTAHLKLGEFNYNGQIADVTQNEDKYKYVDADKIQDIDRILSSKYVTKYNLNPKKLYVMSGKPNTEGSSGTWQDYWCDATDSTMIWDSTPTLRSTSDSVKAIWLKDQSVTGNELLEEAEFRFDSDSNQLKLVLPHKQIDGMESASGDSQYYIPKEIVLPAANRATGEGGVLDSYWVNFLNNLDDKIATMYRMPGGKMRKFISVLTDKSELPKPPIPYTDEKQRDASYYDNRLQYTFNLLQTQLAQLYSLFNQFQSNLEKDWKDAVASDVTATMEEKYNATYDSLDTLKSDISKFQGDVASLSAGIDNSANNLSAHIDAYKSLEDRVSKLENRWGATTTPSTPSTSEQEEIDQIKEDLAELQTQVKGLATSINTTLNASSSSIDDLFQRMYGQQKDGTSGDIHDIDTSIEQLRSQYDYLYDSLNNIYDSIDTVVSNGIEQLYNRVESDLRKKIDADLASLAEQYNLSAEWKPGDYVLVASDETVATDESDSSMVPSTMYVVVPGMVPLESRYIASYYDVYTTTLSTPINFVSTSDKIKRESIKSEYNEALDTYKTAVDTLKRMVPQVFTSGYELGGNGVQDLESSDQLPDVYNSSVMLDELYDSLVVMEGVRGVPGRDYFVLRYKYPDPNSSPTYGYTDPDTQETVNEDVQYQTYVWVSVFFTLDLVNDKTELDVDNPIILSGGTPLAQESRVGGFLNVGSDVYGGGYVSRDESGHLRLNDFELLASGVAAYQLGEDRTEGAGLDISDLQEIFDQYVNERIAFPNTAQLYRASSDEAIQPDVITLELNIGSTSEGELNIHDIDSRFNTSVHLKISGASTENVVLNIVNCQKLRITLDETSNPTIILKNVCLYYDSDVLDRIASIEGLKLWYQRYEDIQPDLEIDGMTVIHQGLLESKGTHDFWTSASSNDNHYAYALRQLTFASDGTIIGIGIAITDDSTNNIIQESKSIFASTFILPQSIGLSYPITKLTKQLKVTGNFVTAYLTENGYSVKNTNFSVLTQKYIKYTDVKEWIQGTISFFTETSIVDDVEGVNDGSLVELDNLFAIDGWESGAYHIFYGGAIE